MRASSALLAVPLLLAVGFGSGAAAAARASAPKAAKSIDLLDPWGNPIEILQIG